MACLDEPRSLSAKYKEDFAYPTVKDRLPVILTKVIDTIHQMKTDVLAKHGEDGTEDLKQVIGLLSKLRNELQTNKVLLPIEDQHVDAEKWNLYLEEDRKKIGEDPAWYVSAWLYTECYFYRRIMQAINTSKLLQEIDPFKDQKCNALTSCMPAVISLLNFLQSNTIQLQDSEQVKRLFMDFLQISLWGNKCDLSISAGVENTQKVNAEASIENLKSFLLEDDKDVVWNHLRKVGSEANIAIVLDNAGFEIITDLVLVEYLLSAKLVKKITLYGKGIPWFVSDVTKQDLTLTLAQLKSEENDVVKSYAMKWQGYMDKGSLIYMDNEYWTLPFDYSRMKSQDSDLYNSLSSHDLILFKGDLNYRKLVGDLKWDYDIPFKAALRGFLPTALCALRTLKSDVVVGISKELAATTEEMDKEWMLTGRWGVIQFAQ